MTNYHNEPNSATTSHHISLLDLNHECLECICEYIPDLWQQIQISKCCSRLREVIKLMWKRRPKGRALEYDRLKYTLSNDDDVRCYINIMRKEFYTLTIVGDGIVDFLKDVEKFGIKTFPSIKKCTCNVEHIIDGCCISDTNIEALSKLVPNLSHLYMSAGVTGKYLSNFQQLESLHLYKDYKRFEIQSENLKDICEKLTNLKLLDVRTWETSYLKMVFEIERCCEMEVLKLNLNTLKPVVKQIVQLPKLKQLVVRLDISLIEKIDNYNEVTRRNVEEYHQILQQRGAEVKGIAIDMEYISFVRLDFRYLQPENLNLLALCGSRFNVSDYVQYNFDQLQILCLRNSTFQTSDIIKMLSRCPALIHLDISYGWSLDMSLLAEISSYWQRDKRSQVLNIYYYGSGFDEDVEKNRTFWDQQKHLRLLHDFPPGSDAGFSYIEQGFAFYF